MQSNVDVRNPTSVRRIGLSALTKELGTVGTIYFIRQYNAGYGDYASEREALLKDITLDEIIGNVCEMDKQYAKEQR